MKIKLKKIATILTLRFWILEAVVVLTSIAFHIINKSSFGDTAITTSVFFTLTAIISTLSRPSSFYVEKNKIYYNDTISKFRKIGGGRPVGIKAQITISPVTNIQLKQNPIERIFNVGHIVFSGETVYEAKKHSDLLSTTDNHTLFGIPHFDEFHNEITKYIITEQEI